MIVRTPDRRVAMLAAVLFALHIGLYVFFACTGRQPGFELFNLLLLIGSGATALNASTMPADMAMDRMVMTALHGRVGLAIQRSGEAVVPRGSTKTLNGIGLYIPIFRPRLSAS